MKKTLVVLLAALAVLCLCAACGVAVVNPKDGGDDENSGNGGNGQENQGQGKDDLSEGVWKDGSITKGGEVKEYKISVTAGTMYFIWWNDSDNTNDRSKTGDVKVNARYSDGTPIFTGVSTGWATPQIFTPANSGTVIVSVQGRYSTNTGTYALRYTTHAGKTTLDKDAWKDDSLVADSQVNEYSFTVTSGITYFIWWNDSDNTNDRSKTGDVKVSARYSDGTPIFTGVDTGWATPQVFTPANSGTVIVSVQGRYSTNTGTYAVRYTTRQSRTALSAGKWENDSLAANSQVNEYSFTVQTGSTYYIWWNDSGQGDASKTCDIKVSARYSNGDAIFTGVDSGWTTSRSLTPASNDTVIVSVQGYRSSNTGTYAVAYTTTNSKP
jgi:hypothetical protein